MKVRRTVAVVTLALTGAVAAHAQVQPQERINTAFARARQAGIPVALLESKIAEGRAKGVPMERIAAAIERRQASLERASQAMRGQTDAAASLAVGADAIESGVSEAVLKAVADNAPRDRRNVAIAALTELVHQGQVPEAALERVRDALKRGPDALTNLPAEGSSNRGPGSSNGQGQGNSQGQRNQGQGQGQGNSGRRTGAEPGPPAGVPAPGDPPQSRRPDNRGPGNEQGSGQGGSGQGGSGQGGSGQGGGQGNNGGGGGGNPTNPGRGR